MKTKEELHKHLDWINQNLEGLTAKKLEVEKQLEEVENAEFDFQKLMPVGSVWLGQNRVVGHFTESTYSVRQNDPIIQVLPNYSPLSIYHAHNIVKAAQHYIEADGDGWHDLNHAVNCAEADGVLQNLE